MTATEVVRDFIKSINHNPELVQQFLDYHRITMDEFVAAVQKGIDNGMPEQKIELITRGTMILLNVDGKLVLKYITGTINPLY